MSIIFNETNFRSWHGIQIMQFQYMSAIVSRFWDTQYDINPNIGR